MSIQKRPVALAPAPQAKAVDAFIDAAPDAKARPQRRMVRGKKEQISLGVSLELLERVDTSAQLMGISRAAWISGAIFARLKQEEVSPAAPIR